METESYEVRSSGRRKRTMTAYREGGELVVVVPSHLSQRQRDELVPPLVARFLAKEAGRRPPRGDAELTARAVELYRAYVAPHSTGPEPALGVRWVTTMEHRWGSCTITTGEIRLSAHLQGMPAWVVDCVLLHEVTHLLVREHNADFWAIVNAHPEAARARGFLEGVEHARAHHADAPG
ncbi:MAG: M48 family metallopeptidase [Propionibacteriaceae bacterium]|nr:M48 family metallopeptidase [Propionibacteriaceae bacterium]